MDVQVFILVKAALLLEGSQRSSLTNKKKERTKQDRYLDETNKKSGNYCKQLMDYIFVNVRIGTTLFSPVLI